MESFDYDILNIFEEYDMENKLTKNNIKSCREICQKYENRLHEKDMTSKFLLFSQFDDCKINYDFIKDVKFKDYEIYNEFLGDEKNKKNHYQKFNMFFGDKKCEIVFEMNNEHSENGKHKLLQNKLYIDENLIIKKESQNSKEFINLTYVVNLLNKLKIEADMGNFLTLLLKTMNLENMFKQILEKIKSNPESHFHNIEWDSASDISMSDTE